jgi:hypothetical protein
VTRERRHNYKWRIEAEGEIHTGSIDAKQKYGRRRSYTLESKLTVTLEIDGWAWCARYEVEGIDGRPMIREIRVVPIDGSTTPPPLPKDVRPLIVPGRVLAEVRAALPALGKAHSEMHGIEDLRTRPERNPHYLYAVLARVYDESCRRGDLHPTAAVARWLEDKWPGVYSARTVPNLIAKARDCKVLSPAPRPKVPGGKLTSYGQDVLTAGPPVGYDGPELPL